MSLARISLDTNVFIFGLRKLDSFAVLILQNLFQFNVQICDQIERELRNNFSKTELNLFYQQIASLSNFQIKYQIPIDKFLMEYHGFGLKMGDAKITAFCEQEAIEFFITENRHFLQNLPGRSFRIIDCETFCEMSGLT